MYFNIMSNLLQGLSKSLAITHYSQTSTCYIAGLYHPLTVYHPKILVTKWEFPFYRFHLSPCPSSVSDPAVPLSTLWSTAGGLRSFFTI